MARLVCCRGCGRDTTRASGYCYQCSGIYYESKKVKAQHGEVELISSEELEIKKTAKEQYNGETERDDI